MVFFPFSFFLSFFLLRIVHELKKEDCAKTDLVFVMPEGQAGG